ncbi:esterase [Bacillus coahuilensis m2-6]|uniref:alpha/beta fold hydrolase n=1 Tax=Bacillus coahuilensis TaxID=408580 RepID=UPI0007505AE2|nr:alpha/beta fold hydrolase [Bacillus coahuilensis]KUP09062.1 esterase [Bacillus coahuilensis m2-6]
MIGIERNKWGQVPFLEVVDFSLRNEAAPFVIFIHGFTSAKEHNLPYAYYLAEKGYRVLLPDTLYHGERQIGLSEIQLGFRFWEIVIQTIKELEILKKSIMNEKRTERIGIAGTSMGGIVTLGALTQYSWIKAAVSLMGSPAPVEFAEKQVEWVKENDSLPLDDKDVSDLLSTLRTFDLSLQPELLNNRPLMLWHGKKDQVVPFQPTYNFYATIYPTYDQKEHIYFMVDEEGEHKVPRPAILKTVEWFCRHI